MKKLITALGLMLCVVIPKGHTEDTKRTPSDIVTYQHKGSSNVALAVSSGGIIYNTEGLINAHESFGYVNTPSTFAFAEVVFSSADYMVLNSTAFTLANPKVLRANQPKFPSPVWPQLWFNQSFSTMVYNATITISGIDSVGSSRTVNVILSTWPAANQHTGFAFVSISSIAIGVLNSTAVAGHGSPLHLVLGSTNAIGLANDIVSAGDVYKALENSTLITSGTINAIYNTYQPAILPRYDVQNSSGLPRETYELWYRAPQSPPRRVFPDRTNITP